MKIQSTPSPCAKLLALKTLVETLTKFEWLFNSRATSHLTNDFSQLSSVTPYHGSNHITMENEQTIFIMHEG